MQAAVLRPCGIIGAHKPNGVELLAGGFERAHDLDGRVVGLGSEDGFPGVAFEQTEEVAVGMASAVEIKQGNFVEEALPALEGLVLHGISGARAWPSDAIEHERGEIGPGRGLAETIVDSVGFHSAQKIAEMEVKRAQGWDSGERIAPGDERAFRGEQAVTALTGIMLGEAKMICNGVGDETGKHEPGNLFFMERCADPAQEQQSGAKGRNIGEWLSKREFPGHEGRKVADVLARGDEDAAEGAVDFAARIGDAGNYNRDPGSWILKQQITSPRSAGGNFVPPIISDDPGAVGSLLGRQRLGSGIREGDATGFQGGKKIALGWRDAIEADEEDFGWQPEVGGVARKRRQSRFEVAGAEPSVAGTFTLKAGGPVPEALGIVLGFVRAPGLLAC